MLVVLVMLGLMLWHDFSAQTLQDAFKQLHVLSLFWAVLAFFIGLALKAERLFYLSKLLSLPHRRLQCLQYQIVTIALAMMTPARSGEFYKAFLLADFQREKLSVGTLIMFVERFADLLVLAFMGTLMACLLMFHQGSTFSWLMLALLCLLCLLVLLPWLFGRLMHFFEPRLPEKIQRFLKNVLQHKQALGAGLLPLILWTVLIWGVEGLFQWSIFKALGVSISLWAVIGISAIVSLAGVLSLLPIGLGMVDLSSLLLYAQVIHIGHEQIVLQVNLARVLGIGGLYLLFLLVLITSPKLVKKAFYKRHNDADGPSPEIEPELK